MFVKWTLNQIRNLYTLFGFELVQNSQLSCMGLIGLNLSISVFELTSKPNKTKKKMNNGYDQLINWFQHPHCHYWHHVFECKQQHSPQQCGTTGSSLAYRVLLYRHCTES